MLSTRLPVAPVTLRCPWVPQFQTANQTSLSCLLHSTLLYSTLLYSTLLFSTLHYSLLCCMILHSSLTSFPRQAGMAPLLFRRASWWTSLRPGLWQSSLATAASSSAPQRDVSEVFLTGHYHNLGGVNNSFVTRVSASERSLLRTCRGLCGKGFFRRPHRKTNVRL